MRILENTTYDFWGIRKTGFIVSGVLLLMALIALVAPGLEAGVDFKGGTEMVVRVQNPVDLGQTRQALAGVLGDDTEVKLYGSARDLLVRTPQTGDIDEIRTRTTGALASAFPGSNPVVGDSYSISPRFSEDLYRGAFYSVIGGLLVIMLYVLARYDWRYGLGAILTLGHDVIVVLGIFALLNAFTPISFTITQTIIAALLTIVGYSVNDTVVVYDRIRETEGLYRSESFPTLANRAINATLSRTIITGVSTILALVVLLIFGGEELRGFALALLIGILLGTYSSIFVSTPIVVWLRERYPVRTRAVRAAAAR
ncbi:MAG TPA: protein translocase subunit SecF [Rubricoccaceae bacterium]|jgi:preprotein translocase SecF subunit